MFRRLLAKKANTSRGNHKNRPLGLKGWPLMSKKRKWMYIALFTVVGLALLALLVVTPHQSEGVIGFDHDLPAYERLLTAADPPIYVAFESQAAPLLEVGVAKAYRSDFVATMIIAVDRDEVRETITGWASLADGDYQVYFPIRDYVQIDFDVAILSMSAGLDFGDGHDNTISLLRRLAKDGRLTADEAAGAPVAIIFDYQAVERSKHGRKLELIVPREGTLSFPVGVLSTQGDQLPRVNREELLAAGFRLPDGTGDPAFYPSPAHYGAARSALITEGKARHVVNAPPALRRQVLGERHFAPANWLENILLYLGFILLTTFWGGMLYMRVPRGKLQQTLFALCGFLLFWMVVRILKLLLPFGAVERFFWYLFYVPLVFIPTLLWRIGLISTRTKPSRGWSLVERLIFVVAAILVLFVLTNDLHQMAFSFYRGVAGDNYDRYYSYGWVYYAVFIWSLALVFAFVFTTIRKKAEAPLKQAMPFIFLLSGAVLYFAGYAWGIPLCRQSEFSIVYGVIALLFLELSFRTRLIPNNILLGTLLRNGPLDLQILADSLEIQYRTAHAAELPPQIVKELGEEIASTKTPFGLTLPGDESLLYGVYRISGGYAVFARHLDEVIKLRAALAEQNRRLEQQNTLLSHTHTITSQITRARTQQELFTRVNTVLKDRLNELEAILAALSADPTAVSQASLQKQLGRIKVLVNYCKRRGNLVLLEAGAEPCATAALALWLQEALWEAETVGVEGLVSEAGKANLRCTEAALVYDGFEHILESALDIAPVVMVVNLSVQEAAVTIRVSLELRSEQTVDEFKPEAAVLAYLAARGASYRLDQDEDGLIIQLTVLRGGGDDA
jgi:hypothetical protein